MLERIEKWVLNVLTQISFLFMIFMGIVIVFLLFRECYHLVVLSFSEDTQVYYYEILEGILSFFIFFEFLTLIITSIRHKGRVSLLFLMSLGITSLVRVLLTYHDSLLGLLSISGAILLLIAGVALLRKFVFVSAEDEHMEMK